MSNELIKRARAQTDLAKITGSNTGFVVNIHQTAEELIAAYEDSLATIERMQTATRHIKPYLVWTVGPESPGHHPTMPSAVGAFLHSMETAHVR